jgi:hypothetical protein
MASSRVTLSWAELLLILLLVIGGWGVWALGVRYLGGQPAGTASPAVAVAAPVLQTLSDVDRWREALVKERLEAARTQAQLAWLQGHYPGLAANAPAGTVPVPDEARASHDTATRNLFVSSQVTGAIEAGLASAEASQHTQRASLARTAADAASAKQADLWRARGVSAVLVALLVLLFSAVLWSTPPAQSIHRGRVIGVACGALMLMITYDLFGTPALMLASVVLVLLFVRAVRVTP